MRTALIVLLLLLGTFLLFWRLDGALLWRDECSTANWARLMVEQGYWAPRVFDGSQLIVQAADGHDFNSELTPAMQSWLQFYVAAAAFKLFGASTWTARLPFALVGAICLFVLYRLGLVLFGSGLRPFLMPYLGLLSIYFLSAARQSRYYVLVVLAASLLFFGSLPLSSGRLTGLPALILHSAGPGRTFAVLLELRELRGNVGLFGGLHLLEGRQTTEPRIPAPFSRHGSDRGGRLRVVPLGVCEPLAPAGTRTAWGNLSLRADQPGQRLLENDSTRWAGPGSVLLIQAKGGHGAP